MDETVLHRYIPSNSVSMVMLPKITPLLERFSAPTFRIPRFSSIGRVQKPIRQYFPSSRRTSPVMSTSPWISSAYAGTDLRGRSSIRFKIFWNKLLGTATSAN